MTRRVAISGALFVAIGLGLFAWKAWVLELPLRPSHPQGLWLLELEITVRGAGENGSVRAMLPSTEVGQRVADEQLVSSGLDFSRRGPEGQRVGVWRGRLSGVTELRHGFRVELAKHAVKLREGKVELPPAEVVEAYLDATVTIPANAVIVDEVLREVSPPGFSDGAGRVRSIFAFVENEITTEERESDDALIALEGRSGSPLGKARVLTAMLRNAEIPARVVHGLDLREGESPIRVHWVEAWLGEWVPMSPSHALLGEKPRQWIAMGRGDRELVSEKGAAALRSRYRAVQERLDPAEVATLMQPPSAWAQKLSLFRLPVATQQALRILLVLPLGALAMAIFRNVIGISTFGTFMPILIALALRTTELGVGILILGSVIGLGIGSRLLIERLHLLLVPRLCILLCIVIFGLTGFALLGREIGSANLPGGVLLPVVILVMLIERFSVTVAEEGLGEAMVRLGWTSVVAFSIYPLFRSPLAEHLMFGFPELVIATVGLLIWLGGYTGFRLSELIRFRSLAQADATADA